MTESSQSSSKLVESKIRRVKKTTISEEIARQIMNLISSGDLKAGQRLPSERALCMRFGASRSSLREALRCLSIVGVLNARVGEGTSIAVDGGKFLQKIMEWRMITERHDIENLLEVRVAIEAVSAAKAARNRTPEDIAALRKLIASMRALDMDEAKFAPLDAEFHVIIANASGNTVISDLVSVIRSQLIRAFIKTLHSPNAIRLAIGEHVAVLKAIENQNADAAREAMLGHLSAALQRYGDDEGEMSSSREMENKIPGSGSARAHKTRTAKN